MRKKRYENVKKIIAVIGIVVVCALIIVFLVWVGCRAYHNMKIKNEADKKIESERKKASEKIYETENFYYGNDDGLDSETESIEELIRQQESEEKDAPLERDVAPEDDINYNVTDAVPEAVPDNNLQPEALQQ